MEERLIRTLDPVMPVYWSKGNPVDMAASISMDAYLQSLEALISWDKVDAVISLSGDAGPLAGMLSDVKKRAEGIIPAEKLENHCPGIRRPDPGLRADLRTHRTNTKSRSSRSVAIWSREGRGRPEICPCPNSEARSARPRPPRYSIEYYRYRRAIGAN